MIKPKIYILHAPFSDFNCRNFDQIERMYSRFQFDGNPCDCVNFEECEINNKEFLDFYHAHKECCVCHKHTLNILYLYLVWNIRKHVPHYVIRCCYCSPIYDGMSDYEFNAQYKRNHAKNKR